MKNIIGILIISFVFPVNAQLLGDWQKVDDKMYPRYFLKNTILPVCGLFDSVTAYEVKGKKNKIKIKSCFNTNYNEIVKVELLEVKNGNFIFKKLNMIEVKDELLNVHYNYEDDEMGIVYQAPTKSLTSFWGIRFSKGEFMVSGESPCYFSKRAGNRLEFKEYFPKLEFSPFPILKEEGETVRYSFIEAYMCPEEGGC